MAVFLKFSRMAKDNWQCLFCYQRQKHWWRYFAIRQTRLVESVTWKEWYAWISISSLSCDLKPKTWTLTPNVNPKPNSKPKH